ncbi:hypothetical protein D3C87_1229800 [compost metagenome]
MLGWLWVHHWSALLAVRLLDVMTAIGTCGAVAVAVGLHRESVMRSNKAQRRRAGLYAVEMFVSLQYFNNLAESPKDLNFKSVSTSLEESEIHKMSWFAAQIVGFDRVRQMDVARLDPISPQISTYFAAGIAQISQGALAVQAVLTEGSERIRQQALRNHLWLMGGFQLFELAMSDLAPEVDERIRRLAY